MGISWSLQVMNRGRHLLFSFGQVSDVLQLAFLSCQIEIHFTDLFSLRKRPRFPTNPSWDRLTSRHRRGLRT